MQLHVAAPVAPAEDDKIVPDALNKGHDDLGDGGERVSRAAETGRAVGRESGSGARGRVKGNGGERWIGRETRREEMRIAAHMIHGKQLGMMAMTIRCSK